MVSLALDAQIELNMLYTLTRHFLEVTDVVWYGPRAAKRGVGTAITRERAVVCGWWCGSNISDFRVQYQF